LYATFTITRDVEGQIGSNLRPKGGIRTMPAKKKAAKKAAKKKK
jgi:hypothetical protein